jgi:uncharacterized protein
MDNEVRGIAFPFRIGGRGGVVMSGRTVEGETHIKEGFLQLLSTQEWERVMTPRGIPPLDIFFNDLNETTKNMVIFKIEEAVRVYEPRIEILDINIEEDEQVDKSMAHVITVSYRILDSGEVQSVSVSIA